MDILDPILNGLRLRSSIFAQMELKGNWGFSKPKLEGSPFYVVASGRCDVRLADGTSVTANAGDLVILTKGEAHDFISGPNAELVPFKRVLKDLGWEVWTPGVLYKTGTLRYGHGQGDITSIIAGIFDFEDFSRNQLLRRLPSILHLPRDGSLALPEGFTSVLRLLVSEVKDRRPGSGSVAVRLADLLFVQVVRTYLQSRPLAEVNWCRGMQDPRVGRALALMHDDPGRCWTVATLANAAGMSRARFADRFHDLVGETPILYLTNWRMHCASRELYDGSKTVTTISLAHGYASEIAFSKAFKRWSGLLPREYRRSSPSWSSNNDEISASPAPLSGDFG